jgi:hypothetical protein
VVVLHEHTYQSIGAPARRLAVPVPERDAGSVVIRPLQLALVEGGEKAVGPVLPSVFFGSNADLVAAVAPLYLAGSVLDVTYGRGMWWRRFLPDPFAFHDLALDGVDFRALPYDDSSWDTVCFDPPYVPRHGDSDATMARDQDFRHRYGLAEPRTEMQLRSLINGGLAECARVSRRWVLVKANDYCNGKQFHMGHVRVVQEAERLGLRCHDLLVHATGTGPGGGQIREVRRARRAHSYLLIFRKPGAR